MGSVPAVNTPVFVEGFKTPAIVHLVRTPKGKPTFVCVRFIRIDSNEHPWVQGGCCAAFLNVLPGRLIIRAAGEVVSATIQAHK